MVSLKFWRCRCVDQGEREEARKKKGCDVKAIQIPLWKVIFNY